MVRVTWVSRGEVMADEREERPLEEAILAALEIWCEDAGPLVVTFADENGAILATAFRPAGGSVYEAVVTHCDGTCERWHCVYVTGEDGMWERTDVRQVA